jgi:hypothetical protein
MSKHPSLTEIVKNLADQSLPASVASSEAAPKGRAKSRLGKKLILVPLDPEMHLKLRHRALDEGSTVEAFVRAAIAAYLSKPASMPREDRG